MEVTEEQQLTVVIDDTVYLHGINHFSEEAYETYAEKLETIGPDLIAAEDYPDKFVASQLGLSQQQAQSETVLSLAYALRQSIPIALIDTDWSDIETGEYGTYQDHITDALDAAGLSEQEYGDASFREYKDINNAIAEHDPAFYRRFIPERDLAMAAHLTWLISNTDYETIVAPMGIAHVENVMEHMLEINQSRTQTQPSKPPLYTADELHDFILSNEEIVEQARQSGGFQTESMVQRQREVYQQQAESLELE